MSYIDTIDDLLVGSNEVYPYSKLIEYLDGWYEHDTDRTNYADYLMSMKNEKSIKKFIRIYNKVLWKFLVKFEGLGDEELVPESWYNIDYMPNTTKAYWRSLNAFLNENIKRLFDTQEYTDKLALECITNLRETSNCDSIRQEIFSISSENVTSIKEKILSSLSVVNEAPEHISPFNIDTNGYIEHRKKYIENVKYLISLGFIKSIKDTTFEMKTKISYIPDTKTLVIIVISFLVLIPLFVVVIHYALIGIFIFLCVLALLKML